MLIKGGDKIKLVKPMGAFTNIGEICDVIDVNSELISFKFGNGMHMGYMTIDEFEKYFVKYTEPKQNTVTQERIDEIMENSIYDVQTVFGKCTIVSCLLPNGFVIIESSAYVSPENYNKEMGVGICYDKIERKIWELEGYRLQEELYQASVMEECPYGCANCDECPCDSEDCEESFEDVCDADYCNNCDDYKCLYNTNDNLFNTDNYHN